MHEYTFNLINTTYLYEYMNISHDPSGIIKNHTFVWQI